MGPDGFESADFVKCVVKRKDVGDFEVREGHLSLGKRFLPVFRR